MMFHLVKALVQSFQIRTLLFLILVTGSAVCTQVEWNVDADGVWEDPSNWNPPQVPTGFDDVVFGSVITAPRTITINQFGDSSAVFFDNDNSYSIVGAWLSIDNSKGIEVDSGSHTIAAQFSQSGTIGIEVDAGAELMMPTVIGGPVFLKKTGEGTLVLSGANTYDGSLFLNGGVVSIANDQNLGGPATNLHFNGGTLNTTTTFTSPRYIILDGPATLSPDASTTLTLTNNFDGYGPLIKEGEGTLVLDIDADYQGVVINNGVLRVANNEVLGSILGTLTFNGGTLNTTASFSAARVIHLDGAGTLSPDGGTTLTLSGLIDGSGSLIVNGAGSVELLGTSSYTGGTTVSQGVLQGTATSIQGQIVNNAQVFFDQGGTGTYSGNMSGTGSLTKNGAGTLIFSGSNTYSGGTTISGGTLQGTTASIQGDIINNGIVNFNQGDAGTYSGSMSGSGSLIKSGPGSVTLSGNNSYTGETTLSGGVLNVSSDGNLGSGNILTFNGGTLNATSSFGSSKEGNLSGAGAVSADENVTLTLSGVVSGSGALTKSGLGTLVLSGSNTYSGDTFLNDGILNITSDNHLGSGTLNFNGGTLRTSGTFTLSKDANLITSGGVSPDGGTTLTISGNIVGNGPLINSGTGTLILSDTNSYSGGTHLNSGTLQVTTDENLGVGDLTFDGGTLSTISTFTTSKKVHLTGAAEISPEQASQLTISGAMDGSGALTKTGTGTLLLDGVNTYSGGTTVSTGILKGNTSGLQGTIVNNGEVIFNQGEAGTYAGVMSGSGSLTKIGFDTLTLSGNNTYSGGTTLSDGTLEGTTSSLQGDIVNNAEVNFNQEGTGTYSGVLSGTGAVGKSGSGTVMMSGNNTYSGRTYFIDGVLSVQTEGNLGVGDLTFDGGTLNTTATFSSAKEISLSGPGTVSPNDSTTLTLSGVISGSGTLIKEGSGILSLSAANTYTGGSTVSEGILEGTATSLQGNIVNNGEVSFSQSGAGTYTGLISGTGTLTKSGTGTLTLSGANTYSGGTTVSTGTLEGTTTSLQGDISNQGVIAFNQPSSGTYSGVISGSGSLTKDGGGAVTLSGVNSYEGSTLFKSGLLSVGSDSNLGNGGELIFDGGTLGTTGTFVSSREVDLSGGGTVSPNASTTFTLSGVISGGGNLMKSGEGTLILNNNNTNTGGLTLSEGVVSVATGGNLGSGGLTFNGGTLNTTATFTTAEGVSLAGVGTVSPNASTTLTLSGIVSGTGVLTKSGLGTLILSNSNTNTGGLILSEGVLSVANGGSFGSGELTFDGGTLNTTATFTIANALNLAGTGMIEPDNGTTLTLSGVVSGTGALTKNGLGTLILSGSNTYTGGTVVSGGVLEGTSTSLVGNIANNGVVTFNQSVNGSYAGVMSGTGALTKSGAGTLTLSGGNTYSGGTSISSGILEGTTTSIQGDIVNHALVTFNQSANGTYSGVLSGSGLFKKAGDGTVTLSGLNQYTGNSLLNGGVLRVSSDSNLGNGGNIIFDGGTLSTTGTFSTGRGVSLSGDGVLSPEESTTLTLSGGINGTGALTKSGEGALILSGANIYSGGTLLSDGTLSVESDGNLGDGGNLTFDGGTLSTTGTFSTARDVSLSGVGTLSPEELTTLTLSGAVSGSGELTKSGEGTLILSGANTYSGGTLLQNGSLSVSSDSKLGSGGEVTFDGGTLSTTATFTTTRGMNLIGEGGVSPEGATTLTLSAVVSGGGSLTKQGPGTLILNGVNTYTGGTTVTSGILEGSTTSLQGDIQNQGVVNFNQGDNGIYAGVISGSGSLLKEGGGSVTLIGKNTYVGGTTISDGTLQGTTVSLQGTLANHATLIFDQELSGTLNGVIEGNGTTEKRGIGTLTLAGSSPFTGTTIVHQGGLEVDGTLGGMLTILPTGTLKGSGSVGSVNNLGNLSPGNSFGTIHITSDYTQAGTGNLTVEVDSNGNSDHLNIGGNANLGGSLTLSPLPGVYSGEEFFTLLTTGGLVRGTFEELIGTGGAKFAVSYFSNSVQIDFIFQGSILPVPISQLSGNAKAVAKYIFCPDFSPSNPDLLSVMRQLVALPPDQFVKELDQLSPAQFGALPLITLQNNRLMADTILMNTEKLYWCTPCNQSEDQKATFWLTPIAQSQSQAPIQDQVGFNARTFGAGAGGSYQLSDSLYLSAGVGYTHSNLGWKENAGDGRLNSIYLAPSIAYVRKNWFANALLQGGFNFYDIERKIRFNGLSRTAHNRHNSYDLLTRIDGGYKWNISKESEKYSFFMMPLARLSYLNTFEDEYSESGAGSINLKVDRKHSAFLQPELLLKSLFEFYTDSYCITPKVELGWVGNVRLTSANYTSRLYKQELCQPNFSVKGFHRNTNQLLVGAGLTMTKTERYSVDLSYEGRFFDGLYINAAKLECDFKF